MSGWQTIWNYNFALSQSISSQLFPIQWGTNEFSFDNEGLTIRSNGNAAGFLTSDRGTADSYGYGKYKITFTMPPHQAAGAYICLWPATNIWPGPEIDLAEQLNGSQYLTVHWKGNDGSNQYHSYFFNANLANLTTATVVWNNSSLNFLVNDQVVVQLQSGGPVPIPKDYAHGGQNEAFGVGNVGPVGTSVTVSAMSYAQSLVSSSSSAASAGLISHTSVGNPGATSSQFLYTQPGADILTGGHGHDTFKIDTAGPDGWAEIKNWHSSDLADFVGAKLGVSRITWANATDPSGHEGATASISMGGNGHVDSAVTFVGMDATAMQGKWISAGTDHGVADFRLHG